MSRFVDEIEASGAGAVLISLVGQDAVSFNRAFGAAGADTKVVRLSCAIEENGLLACGKANTNRLFAASSYFGTLHTDENAAFKERYYGVHGDEAPVLNALGQSTYEGMHFLAGLLLSHSDTWRENSSRNSLLVNHKSGRKNNKLALESGAPIFLSQANGLTFDVIKQL
jgi:ABC-type branched-subunit amino acid transport system substrate-binding protein